MFNSLLHELLNRTHIHLDTLFYCFRRIETFPNKTQNHIS